MAATFVGFSTIGRLKPPFSLKNEDLIKQDLLNAFNTRRGELVMNPLFGSIIHDVIMDPLDAISKNEIVEDVRKIIDQEPRVTLDSDIIVIELDSGVKIDVQLYYVPFDNSEKLEIIFKQKMRESK